MEVERIRNFVIISHVDHGKSTLADRFLEATHTVEHRKMHPQYLDRMPLEQEKGITIKMQPVRMHHQARIHADNKAQINADDGTRIDADKEIQINVDKNMGGGGLLYEDLTYKIRGAIFRVYNTLGSGHKENVYQNALEEELKNHGISFQREKSIDVIYADKKVGVYRPDLIVEDKILIEIKAISFLGKVERKQIWHYLKGSDYHLTLLVNFGSKKAEVERIVFDTARPNPHISASPYQRQSASSHLRESALVLNLIDTPGHVDFSYEVSRSLAAVEGAVLLVDATQGVQAQTLSNLHLAREEGLVIIPAVNKIDSPSARIEESQRELAALLNRDPGEILRISGKEGTGVEELLQRIVTTIPSPGGDARAPLRALIFDSAYDPFKGVLAYVRIVDGKVKRGDRIRFAATGAESEVIETGFFSPDLQPVEELASGEIGYIATGVKSSALVRVGDTVTGAEAERTPAPLPGYQDPKPMVFVSFYPEDSDEFNSLKDALEKLHLNDAALTYSPESSEAFGRGFRCGFLGMLHVEITRERLQREHHINLITSSPSVRYEITEKGGGVRIIHSPHELPDPSGILAVREPWMKLEIITPASYLGNVLTLLATTRGVAQTTTYLTPERALVHYEIPLADIITTFYDRLKSVSSGYASMNYEPLEYRPWDLVKLDILVAGEPVSAFARIVPRKDAETEGRRVVERLKEILPRENFAVALQAAIGGKIIARETIPALRKDVTGYLYGGDVTRKKKLLEKQKRGKKKMKTLGRVRIPSQVFLEMLKQG